MIDLETAVSLILMMLEILIAECLFGLLFNKKKHYILKLFVGSIASVEAVALLILFFFAITDISFTYMGGGGGWQLSLFKFFLYVVIFAITVILFKLCYDGSWLLTLFYCAGAYAAQHIAKNVHNILSLFLPAFESPAGFWIDLGIELTICAFVYFVVWLLMIRNKTQELDNKDLAVKVFISLVTILICIGLSRISFDNPYPMFLSTFAESGYAIVSCVLILFLLSGQTKVDSMRQEIGILGDILRKEKEQFKISKENIDIINMKCHDLKHQLGLLQGSIDEAELKKIKDAVMIYGNIVKTGNYVLDVILMEKSLLCEKNAITLTCVAKGNDLGFMEDADIYSLLGNALSNAIESVMKIKDADRRIISLNISTVANVFSIHIENYYDGELVFENGYPKTSKDTNFHGFGMKSMDYIAKKYKGYMSVSAEDGLFVLDFIFSLDEAKKAKAKIDEKK